MITASILMLGSQSCKEVKKQETNREDTATEASYLNTSDGYIPTEVPEDVTELFVDFTDGDVYDNDSVLLICQGGPMPMLLPKKEVVDHISDYHKKYGTYLVHQAQTYNTKLFANQLSFDQITQESKTSVDMLHKVIQHFKQQGKKVYLWGSSFGFFVVENYIANYGTDDITGAFAGNGRLDMNEVVWKGFSLGQTYMFDETAMIPVADEPESEDGPEEEMQEEMKGEEVDYEYGANAPGGLDLTPEQMENFTKNITAMAAGLGQYRHTKLLADKDLSKVIFYYGEFDRVVGTLTDDEITFLTQTLAPEKRPELIKGVGLGHGSKPEEEHEAGEDYTLEIMQKLFAK